MLFSAARSPPVTPPNGSTASKRYPPVQITTTLLQADKDAKCYVNVVYTDGGQQTDIL